MPVYNAIRCSENKEGFFYQPSFSLICANHFTNTTHKKRRPGSSSFLGEGMNWPPKRRGYRVLPVALRPSL
jgi:hypothetical protein